jgi:beta-lactam-binding protein with PASTA domain
MSFKNFILSKLFLKNLGFAIIIAVGGVMILMIWMNFYTRHGQARPVPDFVGMTMEQTVKLAKKSKLRYQIIDSIYTTTVPRGCIAEQNPKPGFKVKKWRNIVLTINAFHPEMVAMPNLVNLPLRQATALIESSGLEVGQRKYRPDISINVVIEQQYNGKLIHEGDSIQKGSVVDLILGKGLSNERTTIPYLIGMKLEPAKNKILVSSLNLGTFVYDKTIVNSKDSINAFVYKQIPEYKDNATLQLGSMVYLWLTADPAKLKIDSTKVISDTIPAIPTPDTQNN